MNPDPTPTTCPPHLVAQARAELIATGLHPDPEPAVIDAWWAGYQTRLPDTVQLTPPPAGFPGTTPTNTGPDDTARCTLCRGPICNHCGGCNCPDLLRCRGHHQENQ